jgi:hypothetical protein
VVKSQIQKKNKNIKLEIIKIYKKNNLK